MKSFSVALTTLLAFTALASAQIKPVPGKVFTPDSSIERPSDLGKRAHTNLQLFLPTAGLKNAQPMGAPYSGYGYETPASLGCVYGLVKVVSGCNPNKVNTNPTGGSKMIAIVDAYDAPKAASDLALFWHLYP